MANKEEQDKSAVTEKGASSLIVNLIGWGALFIGLYFILSNLTLFPSSGFDPKAGLIVIFFTGLLTSLHCVGMCGGFVLSYSSNTKTTGVAPHLCYNGSRILSYTVFGALMGLVGSALSFNAQIRSYLAIFAGLFMLMFGLSMFFPKLRRFVTLPGLGFDAVSSTSKKGPIFMGLLNGLMPCGPMQAMLIYAAGTGSAIEGALVMLAFGLGTVPLMLAVGTFASFLASRKNIVHTMMKVSAVLVLVLGLLMLGRGLALSGIDLLPGFSRTVPAVNQTVLLSNSTGYQQITMHIVQQGWQPDIFTVKKGIPVKWTIIADQLTSCNRGIKIPKLGISYTFNQGETKTFEFTPNETGSIPFTCWMGMISGRIDVVD